MLRDERCCESSPILFIHSNFSFHQLIETSSDAFLLLSLKQGPLVTCFGCDDAYHYFCHTTRITMSKSNSKWFCNECTQKQQCKTSDNQIMSSMNGVSRSNSPTNSAPILPPVLSPQVSPSRGSCEQIEEEGGIRGPIDLNIPDARNWTSEQVYQYFARLFPKEAEVFRQQVSVGFIKFLKLRRTVYSLCSIRDLADYDHSSRILPARVPGDRRPCAYHDEPDGRAAWTWLALGSCLKNIPPRPEASVSQR